MILITSNIKHLDKALAEDMSDKHPPQRALQKPWIRSSQTFPTCTTCDTIYVQTYI